MAELYKVEKEGRSLVLGLGGVWGWDGMLCVARDSVKLADFVDC